MNSTKFIYETTKTPHTPMNQKSNSLWTLCLLALALVCSMTTPSIQSADANPPAKMSYRGFLVDGNGVPLGDANPQNFDVTFRIYNATQGGDLLWSEQQTVTVDKGNFSVFLGEGSSVGSEPNGPLASTFTGVDVSDRFIGLTVTGLGGEIAPRLQFLSSAFTFLSKNATALVGPDGQPILTGSNGTIQSAGGNPRGLGAVDLQTVRVDPAQVASGAKSVVAGGENNISSGAHSNVSGGLGNIASGPGSVVGGGGLNKALALNSAVVAGGGNEARGIGSVVVGGGSNIADNNDSFVGAGFSNEATGLQSFVGGGLDNIATADYTTVTGGSNNQATFSGAFIGGGTQNRVENNFNSVVTGGFINLASGLESFVGGGTLNQALADRSAVVGGVQNVVAATGGNGTIAGGHLNIVSGVNASVGGGHSNDASGTGATISGGNDNTASGVESTVGGGLVNLAAGLRSTVAGGVDNHATVDHATVGGGYLNRAWGANSTVAGGTNNQATAPGASVLGGTDNLASGDGATVSGGYRNHATERDSWAGGHYAKAHHTGSFVWSDSSLDADFGSTGDNQFVVRATGGMAINGAPDKAVFQVHGAKSSAIGAYSWLTLSPITGTLGGGNVANFSIWASDRIACLEFNAFSDERAKNVMGISNREEDLESLMAIEITDYQFKDTLGKGSKTHKKVIAQQVREILPNVVSETTDVIPDIYQRAERVGPWVQLKTDLKRGDRVRLINEGGQHVYEVLEVTDGKFRVEMDERNEPVFVYGREVDDFQMVDYDALSTLNISATQQLYKLVQDQQEKIGRQEVMIRELVSSKDQEIAQLKNQLSTITKLVQALVTDRNAGAVNVSLNE